MEYNLLQDIQNNKQLLDKLISEKKKLTNPPKPNSTTQINQQNVIHILTYSSQAVVLVGGLGWGVISLFDLYNKKSDGSDNWKGMVMGTIGLCSLCLILIKGLKPSFVGDYTIPPSVMFESYPRNHDLVYKLKTDPNTFVIYWASKKSKIKDATQPEEHAYGKYDNAGVVKSNEFGEANIYLKYPIRIITKDFLPRILNKHFCYRTLHNQSGRLSDIKKIDIEEYCPYSPMKIEEQPKQKTQEDIRDISSYLLPIEVMEPLITQQNK